MYIRTSCVVNLGGTVPLRPKVPLVPFKMKALFDTKNLLLLKM